MFPSYEDKDIRLFLDEIERLSGIKDNKIAAQALAQLKDILDSLNQLKPVSGSNSPDSPSTYAFFSQDVNKLSNEPSLILLRQQLIKLIDDKELTAIVAESVLKLAFDLSIQLAIKMPLNDFDLNCGDKLLPGRVVYTSSGYRFDLEEIIHCFITHKRYLNPYSNLQFSPLDVQHIIDAVIRYDELDKPELLTAFIKSLGYPSGIVYVDRLLFLTDVNGKPKSILADSIHATDLPKAAKELISTRPNIIEALYERHISITDIKEMPIENLRSLGTFRRTLLILQSEDSCNFLHLLKNQKFY